MECCVKISVLVEPARRLADVLCIGPVESEPAMLCMDPGVAVNVQQV